MSFLTLYFQGSGATREQVQMFTNESHTVLTQDRCHPETVFPADPTRPPILHNIYAWRELPCVEYARPWYRAIISPAYLKKALENFLGWRNERLVFCNPATASLAGYHDVTEAMFAVHSAIAQHPQTDLVLAGFSRGASTMFTTATVLKDEVLEHVKLLLLFAPFDSIDTLFEDRGYPWNWLTRPFWLYRYLFTSDLQKEGPKTRSPLEAATDFPLDVPVAFVMGGRDTVVPSFCTRRLIDALKKGGHQNVHVLHLPDATHDESLAESPETLIFIEELYAKYLCKK